MIGSSLLMLPYSVTLAEGGRSSTSCVSTAESGPEAQKTRNEHQYNVVAEM